MNDLLLILKGPFLLISLLANYINQAVKHWTLLLTVLHAHFCQFPHPGCTFGRTLQHVLSSLQTFHYFVVCSKRQRCFTVTVDLPEENSKRPDVTSLGVFIEKYGFAWHPAEGNEALVDEYVVTGVPVTAEGQTGDLHL